ncbi:LysR substrate-binding domain-containing protein [Caldimonas brevitalea]|uniref:LysR family transcriptional regulator n=1 Tax=Caldimonas brevitalea TaxID=413882 RepID=A0A0G3BVY2_9BURK|nr:LysR substrate-binding domain-containing protein [Caldimonas brevitalea]AKJ32188.1 LysR family transcriptional regulator [Caldimonas brevitalea]
MDKLRSMEVFVAVAEAGSFAAAARRLDLSAVMVGKHVQELETYLGTRLIQRTTRRQHLTEAGRAYCEDCKKVLEQVRWAEASIEGLRSEPSGLLRVSAPVTLGAAVVAAHVGDYLQRHPQVRVELVLSDSLVDLVEEGYDLAVRIGERVDAHLVARPLAPYRVVVCAAPEYLRRHGRPLSPADLPRHRCLSHLVWTRRTSWQLMGGEPGGDWPQDAVFASNNGEALRRAALQGAGLLMQPEVLVADDLAAGRLVPVLDDFLPAPRPVHLVYLPDRQALPKLRSFIAHLLACMAPSSVA